MSNLKERIKQIDYDEPTLQYVIYRLLEYAIVATGRGEKYEDYTESLSFPIGSASITADHYYGSVRVESADMDGEIEDKDTLKAIIKELKKRLTAFDKKIFKIREEITKEVFDEPFVLFNDNDD